HQPGGRGTRRRIADPIARPQPMLRQPGRRAPHGSVQLAVVNEAILVDDGNAVGQLGGMAAQRVSNVHGAALPSSSCQALGLASTSLPETIGILTASLGAEDAISAR